jgi:hypothetical protein
LEVVLAFIPWEVAKELTDTVPEGFDSEAFRQERL